MNFSIVVPSFNQARFLSQNLDSILSQPELLECLVYDANSSDGSKEILKKYAKKFPKLWYQSIKDGGQVAAINLGLKRARGGIVAYLNSDDYYLPGAFLKVKEYFETHPDCHWLVGDCEVTQKNLRWTFFLKNFLPLSFFNSINQPSVFLRRDFVKVVGNFDTRYQYAFDYDYWLRCQSISRPHRLHQTTSVFRVHSDSKGNRSYEAQFAEDLEITNAHTKNQILYLCHYAISKIVVTVYSLLKN